MPERLTADQWLHQLRPDMRILLINPYVQDVRYPWVRWNQPVDLLKLARLLVSKFGCQVELVDCMLPSEAGRVADRYLEDLYTGDRYRTFGVVIDKAQRTLLSELNREWPPDYVVMSTLTSYWGPRVIPAIRAALRSAMPQVKVALGGPFAAFESERAARTMVDVLVTSPFPSWDMIPMWELYHSRRARAFHEGRRCRFAGLTFDRNGNEAFVVEQVTTARKVGINTFVFFVEDLFANEGLPLKEGLLAIIREHGRLQFHGLCGITPSRGSSDLWRLMIESGYHSVYFEYDLEGSELRVDGYVRAMEVLSERLQPGDVSGFVVVGAPHDDLRRLVMHTLDILATAGSVIPKPFTPSPFEDRAYYDEIVRHVDGRLDKMGPRAFPLAGHPDQPLTIEDFEDFFSLTTELNKKLQGRPFDFFDQSAITEAFRSSLSKGVWRLVEY